MMLSYLLSVENGNMASIRFLNSAYYFDMMLCL